MTLISYAALLRHARNQLHVSPINAIERPFCRLFAVGFRLEAPLYLDRLAGYFVTRYAIVEEVNRLWARAQRNGNNYFKGAIWL